MMYLFEIELRASYQQVGYYDDYYVVAENIPQACDKVKKYMADQHKIPEDEVRIITMKSLDQRVIV